MNTTTEHCCVVDQVAETGDTVYVFTVEGQPIIGTLDDYADAWEHAHYAGLSISGEVWRFETDATLSEGLPVVIDRSEPDERNFYTYTFTVRAKDDIAYGRIDGAA